MLRSDTTRMIALMLLAAVGAVADPALYWGSQAAVGGSAAGPDLIGPDGAAVPSGSDWLVQLVDAASGDVLLAAPAGAIMDIGQGAARGVFYATVLEAGTWRGRAVATRLFNSDNAATASRWAQFSNTLTLTWDTVPRPPATVTYSAGQVAQRDWREFDNTLAPENQTPCIDSTAQWVVPLRLTVDEDLCSLSFVLGFDPTLLRAVSYRAAGRTAVVAVADGIDQAGGRITISLGQLGGGTAIGAGSGPIAEAVFELQAGVAAGVTPLTLSAVEAWTAALLGKPLSSRDGVVELTNCSLYTLMYLPGVNGAIEGPTPQTVRHGADAVAVTAVPAFGYHFEDWSDGSTTNPRRDLCVTASQTLTAAFQSSAAVPADGIFLACPDSPGSATRGLWDLTGTYVTTIAGQPLTMDLLHEPSGRVGGTATYAFGKGPLVSMPVRGAVKGLPAGITLRGSLTGADPARTTRVALALHLTVDPAHLLLVGQIRGSVTSGGLSTPVAQDVALPIPAPMDGAWTLRLELTPAVRAVTGTARLTLANGVDYVYAVAGRARGQRMVLSLAGNSADPAARAVRLRATITPLEGGWARLETFSCRGYGQVLAW